MLSVIWFNYTVEKADIHPDAVQVRAEVCV